MNKRQIILLTILVIILIVSCKKEKEIFYQSKSGKLMTATKVDSILDARTKKMQDQDIDMSFRKEITDTLISENQIIYKFTIKGESKGVKENVASYKKMIGTILPKFSLKNLNGDIINSNDLKGKPMVINMWFTTCPPCIAEMPELNKIKEEYKKTDVQFLAFTYESKEKVETFLQKRDFDFMQIAGAKEYYEQFTNQYPINIFVNRAGIINHIEAGMPLIYDAQKREITNNVNPMNFIKALNNILK